MSNVVESKHVTTIVRNRSGEEVKRFADNRPMAQAMREFAEEIGVDPALVQSGRIGTRLTVPGVGDFRATYRRA